jgi:hypothetical protein
MDLPVYKLTLQSSYYEKGFFNLGIAVDQFIRADSGPITLLLGQERQEIHAQVDRNANQNGAPRIFGKSELSDWFQQNFQLMATLDVVILGPTQLWLKKSHQDDNLSSASVTTQMNISAPAKINGSHNFQRIGAVSNARAGDDFELQVQRYFASKGVTLTRNHSVHIGVAASRKAHRFDLGSDIHKIIVECKSHTWTAGDKVPSAKVTVWNEVMFYFMLAPSDYQKILFVLKSHSPKRKQTLAYYYMRIYEHLIPAGVEIWEYDPDTGEAELIQK